MTTMPPVANQAIRYLTLLSTITLLVSCKTDRPKAETMHPSVEVIWMKSVIKSKKPASVVWELVSLHDLLYAQNRLQTYENATASLAYSPTQVLQVRENTQIVIGDLEGDVEGKRSSARLDVLEGWIRSEASDTAMDPLSLTYTTPNAILRRSGSARQGGASSIIVGSGCLQQRKSWKRTEGEFGSRARLAGARHLDLHSPSPTGGQIDKALRGVEKGLDTQGRIGYIEGR